MSDEIEKPDLETSLRVLNNRDEFKVVLSSIEAERDNLLLEMSDKVEPFEIAKLNGEQAGLTRLIANLRMT